MSATTKEEWKWLLMTVTKPVDSKEDTLVSPFAQVKIGGKLF